MTEINANLISEIATELRNFEEFASQRQLRSAFADPRLNMWHNSVPEAATPTGRVEAIIDFLLRRSTADGKNALVLLLETLSESQPSPSSKLQKLTTALEGELAQHGVDELSSEQRIFDENPYIFGVPVRGKDNFFGREEELRTIFQTLDSVGRGKKQDMAIVGPRRIGKSSLLYRLVDLLEHSPNFVPVYLDLQNTPTLHELLLDCAEKIEVAYELLGFADKLPTSSFLKQEMEDASVGKQFRIFRKDIARLSNAIEANGLPRLVLMFDEVDLLLSFGDSTILGRFRALIQHTFYAVFIVAGSTLLNSLLQDHGSPFFNIFKIISVEPLSVQAADALIEVPASRIGMVIGQTEVNTILQYAGNNPYFIQGIAHYLVEELNVQGRREVHARDVTKVIKEAAQYLSLHLDYFWNSVTKIQRAILYKLAEMQQPQWVETIVAQLGDTHTIEQTQKEQERWFEGLVDEQILTRNHAGRYWFTAQLFVDWILTTVDKNSVLSQLSEVVTDKSTFTPITEEKEIDWSRLRQLISQYFSLSELRTLMFDLNIDFEEFGDRSKSGLTRELILYLERHQRIPELIKALERQRPNVDWSQPHS